MQVVKSVAHFETILVDAIDKDSVSLSLDSIATPEGNLPAGLYGFVLEQESNSKREYVIGTLSGSTLTFSARDVSPLDGSTANSSGDDERKKHRKGSSVKLTNHPVLTQIYRLMSGLVGIDADNPIFYDAEPVLASREQLATVGYVNDTVNGGVVSYEKLVITGNAGETVAAGDPLYLNTTDQEWYKADADTTYTRQTQFGIAQGAGTNGNAISGGILIRGVDTNQSGMTLGAAQYLSTTAGEITETPPAKQVFVGIAKSATALIVNFDSSQLNQMQSGMIMPYAADTAPTGWLNCDGSAVALNDYLDLFEVLNDDNLAYGVGTAVAFTADDATDIFTASTHGLNDGDIVFVRSAGTLPSGLTADTAYYVRDKTTNTFKLSATAGGSAIDISTAGSGVHSFYETFKVPDLRSRTLLGYSGGAAPTLDFEFLDAAVDTGTDVITVESNDTIKTGMALVLSNSGGALPSGLSATTYYAIRVSATTLKLATSVANANAGTAVDITAAAGGGTHKLRLTLTQRNMGVKGGSETHALTDAEIPSHTHDLLAKGTTANGSVGTQSAQSATAENIESGSKGSDTPFNIMNPYAVVNFIIKT